jgi:hypothetical protein
LDEHRVLREREREKEGKIDETRCWTRRYCPSAAGGRVHVDGWDEWND